MFPPRGGACDPEANFRLRLAMQRARQINMPQENIQRAIEYASGRIYGPGGAAELLGLTPTTLPSRMKDLVIPRPRT